MTWWILLACLVASVWGLVDTIDRDPGAARLWAAALAVTVGLAYALYAQQEGLLDWERDTGRAHEFQTIREEE